ncbi:hypothetical protein BAU15_02785 [Enterococcus sp. JM4C]|uniref:LytTR family DNA-binding domain-containing protein n=1 Tax=Candidatus Enterococcus huntleyi TaxID=1857217 RepID=UPI00137AD6A0|nr:LytTR family DNA-binding domain-containing protein [Enterococcus sp. JM4C]KAF1299587.1 hypothetical protein BAU15_02785 [Enterococcus sp. JM4C]
MKSRVEIVEVDQEESVHLKIHELTGTIEKALALLTEKENFLLGELNGEMYRIPFLNVLYVEVVDKRSYLYTKGQVYQSNEKLYQLEEKLLPYNFLRISKSMLLNVEAILSVSPMLSGRLEATLLNHERVAISRKYVPALKKGLGMGRKE